MTRAWRRQQLNGEEAGVVHFCGSDAQGEHSTLCGHSMNFNERASRYDGQRSITYTDTSEDPVTCPVCLRAADQVLQILGIPKARRAAIIQKAAGT